MPWVTGQQIVAEVEQFTGQPYVWGGVAPGGFDCSGLVQYVLTQLGVPNVPRTSEEQYAWAVPVNQPSPGDLVFAQFPGDQQASPGHVGVYTGGGQVLSAQDPATGVQSSALATWGPYIVGYGRAQGEAMAGPFSDPKQAAAADKAAADNNALWYTFTGIGRAYLVRRGTLAASDADSASVHGYPTIEAAYAAPNGINALSQVTITQWDAAASLPVGGGEIGVIETVNIAAPTTPGGQPTVSTPQNPATASVPDPLVSIGAALKAFYTAITDGKMWRSLGWIILGAILIGFALWSWFKSEMAKSGTPLPIPPVVPV